MTTPTRTSGDHPQVIYYEASVGYLKSKGRHKAESDYTDYEAAVHTWTTANSQRGIQEINTRSAWELFRFPAAIATNTSRPLFSDFLPFLLSSEHAARVAPDADWEPGGSNDGLHRGAEEVAEVCTIRAAHSDDSESIETAITGVEIVQDGFAVALSVPSDSRTSHDAAITFTGETAPTAGLAVRLTARNDCGPAIVEIHTP